jgi:hypothetical protein
MRTPGAELVAKYLRLVEEGWTDDTALAIISEGKDLPGMLAKLQGAARVYLEPGKLPQDFPNEAGRALTRLALPGTQGGVDPVLALCGHGSPGQIQRTLEQRTASGPPLPHHFLPDSSPSRFRAVPAASSSSGAPVAQWSSESHTVPPRSPHASAYRSGPGHLSATIKTAPGIPLPPGLHHPLPHFSPPGAAYFGGARRWGRDGRAFPALPCWGLLGLGV